jgi:hypothetical protein
MNIFEKLCRIQNEIKVPKTEYNPFGNFNYRSAEGILQIVKPLCLKHQVTLILTDSIEVIEGRFFVKTIAELIDWTVDGETTGKVVSMPGYAEFPALKAKTDEAQRTGIASSYAKKRALEALFSLSSEADSDAIPPDKEIEKMESMQKNQKKLDEIENWRMTNDGIEVKGQNGFVPVSKLSVAQLQVIVKMKKFEGIRADLERELANR